MEQEHRAGDRTSQIARQSGADLLILCQMPTFFIPILYIRCPETLQIACTSFHILLLIRVLRVLMMKHNIMSIRVIAPPNDRREEQYTEEQRRGRQEGRVTDSWHTHFEQAPKRQKIPPPNLTSPLVGPLCPPSRPRGMAVRRAIEQTATDHEGHEEDLIISGAEYAQLQALLRDLLTPSKEAHKQMQRYVKQTRQGGEPLLSRVCLLRLLDRNGQDTAKAILRRLCLAGLPIDVRERCVRGVLEGEGAEGYITRSVSISSEELGGWIRQGELYHSVQTRVFSGILGSILLYKNPDR